MTLYLIKKFKWYFFIKEMNFFDQRNELLNFSFQKHNSLVSDNQNASFSTMPHSKNTSYSK